MGENTDRYPTVYYEPDQRRVGFRLTLAQFVIALIVCVITVATPAVSVAMWIGKMQIQEWWNGKGQPQVEQIIDARIVNHTLASEAHVSSIVDEKLDNLKNEIAAANQLASTNKEILNRIETDVRELRQEVKR